MVLIGVLVAFGTFLMVAGGLFSSSVEVASREAIIDNFTGDFIVYSAKSKEKPSPFAFTTPLPVMKNPEEVEKVIAALDGLESYTFYTQNYGLIQVEREGKKQDLPFIFYAVDPGPYAEVFNNLRVQEGDYFGMTRENLSSKEQASSMQGSSYSGGILISRYQNAQYMKNYGITLQAGQPLTLLGITEGGVNTVPSTLRGIFTPLHYSSVFDYINFMDAGTYARLYNFSGVASLPEAFDDALTGAMNEEDIFSLADEDGLDSLDVSSLQTEALSGYTVAAVKFIDRNKADAAREVLKAHPELGVKVATWKEASGFYSQISLSLQAAVAVATALVFLVVIMIFMNTLIINVVERTGEIGTMRAIGADKSFVRRLFLTEALILNLSSAILAMLGSAILALAMSSKGVPLPETVSQFLIGGGPLPLRLSVIPFALASVSVVVVSVLATLYPVRLATSIQPLVAMQEN